MPTIMTDPAAPVNLGPCARRSRTGGCPDPGGSPTRANIIRGRPTGRPLSFSRDLPEQAVSSVPPQGDPDMAPTRRLTGFKPTGHLHLGNLLGALRPLI